MSAPVTITTAAHVAYLDPLSGEGLLVLPAPTSDVLDPFDRGSMHESDWSSMIRRLDRLGWEPSEAEDGGMCEVGCTLDGRTVVGLYGRDPITTEPDLQDMARAGQELAQLAGLNLDPA